MREREMDQAALAGLSGRPSVDSSKWMTTLYHICDIVHVYTGAVQGGFDGSKHSKGGACGSSVMCAVVRHVRVVFPR